MLPCTRCSAVRTALRAVADDGDVGQGGNDELLEGGEVELLDALHQHLEVLQPQCWVVSHHAVHLGHGEGIGVTGEGGRGEGGYYFREYVRKIIIIIRRHLQKYGWTELYTCTYIYIWYSEC